MAGHALATDYFLVRETLTDEQWEHFLATRRFVDDEVLPVINDYWERAELPWPLFRRLAELGVVGEDIEGYGCPAMSPVRWLPAMARVESLGGFALTEPEHGSDPVALESSARRDGDGGCSTGRSDGSATARSAMSCGRATPPTDR